MMSLLEICELLAGIVSYTFEKCENHDEDVPEEGETQKSPTDLSEEEVTQSSTTALAMVGI